MLHALVAAAVLAGPPQVGAPAPAFRVTTVDGRALSLAALRGKVVVVNDWATWCPPCREETPALVAAAKRAGPNVVFVGVDSTESAPIVRAFVADKHVPYAEAIDADHAFMRAYDITEFPSTFVIGPDGVLRARVLASLDAPTLASLEADARAGRDGVVESAAQRKADAILAPSRFHFTGGPGAVRAQAKAVLAAVDAAENVDGVVDDARLQREANVLRDRAAAALAPIATTPADLVVLARLRGDAAAGDGRWADAAIAYRDGLSADPRDPDLLAALSLTYAERHEPLEAARWSARAAAAAPGKGFEIDEGVAYGGAHDFAASRAAFARAVALGGAAVARRPHDVRARRLYASAELYDGRMELDAGDRAAAHAAFAAAQRIAALLPRSDARFAMDAQEAQEGLVAAASLAPRNGATALSVSPWTGADLPGSIPSTYKYRLVVAGTPGRRVALAASGLPAGWVASFCSDRVCAPFRTAVALPAAGVKIVELQLIPEADRHGAATVRIRGGGATASVTVAARG